MSLKILLSCEHITHHIPTAYQHLFAEHESILLSHRGWDMGAVFLFNTLKEALHADGYAASVSRLLVDTNRSATSRHLFSEFTEVLSAAEKELILAHYYRPYRDEVTHAIGNLITQGHTVLHLSIHSFTPVLNGVKRTNDVGLLYDPQRLLEKKFCHHLKMRLHDQRPAYRVRFNYPYKGIEDGLTRTLRNTFLQKNYIGIEIETNQSHFTADGLPTSTLTNQLLSAIHNTLIDFTI